MQRQKACRVWIWWLANTALHQEFGGEVKAINLGLGMWLSGAGGALGLINLVWHCKTVTPTLKRYSRRISEFKASLSYLSKTFSIKQTIRETDLFLCEFYY